MLLLSVPPAPNVDISVTRKIELVTDCSSSSIYLERCFNAIDADFLKIDFTKNFVISTDVTIKRPGDMLSSTWKESVAEDFDITADMLLGRNVTVKARIKSITKYIPKIVID